MSFLALFISLPTKGGTDRMRVWRALKALGCATLRDGVYLLPDAPEHAQALEEVATDVRSAGGSAAIHLLCGRDRAQEKALTGLFDRSAEYAQVADEVRRFLSEVEALDAGAAARREQQLARRFEQVMRVDYVDSRGGPARDQVAALIDEARRAVVRLVSPDEPSGRSAPIPRLSRSDYQHRVWATRKRPWVDRLASAWLIARHIDPDARFVWLDAPQDCRAEWIGFDFDGATFSHVGHKVSVETLLASFGLESDRALARVGELVHFLDVGGLACAEAPGVEALLAGARARCPDDDALLREAMRVFDWLYSAYAAQADQAVTVNDNNLGDNNLESR